MKKSFAGGARQTSLAAAITNSAMSFTVQAGGGSGYPTGSEGPFVVSIDIGLAAEEKILCSARATDTFTVATDGRGYDDTSAAAHNNSALVDHVLDAVTVREANAHANDSTADVHPQYLTAAEASAAYQPKQLIAETVLTGAAATIDFTSIPQTFTHLELVVSARSDVAGVGPRGLHLRINNDSGVGYVWQYLRAQNTTVSAAASSGVTSIGCGLVGAAGDLANSPGITKIVLPDYARATLLKKVLAESVEFTTTAASGAYMDVRAGMLNSTAAVTRLTLFPDSGNFVAGTVVSLYGIK